LASGSHDKTTRLWDAVTGKELLTLKGHANGVWFIAFSPDGKSLVSASNVGIMKLWDTLTGKELLTFRARLGYMHSIALSPDGRRLAVAFDVGIIKLWDTLTGKELLAFKAHAHGVWSVAFSPDGRLLASGGGDRIIKLWDTLDWTRSAKGMRKVKVTGDSRNTPAAKNLRQYVVKERDTLWGIALAVYGQGKHWRLIVEANPGIRPAALKVGQVLVIPPMPKPANRPAK
jgi:WD40 repeat protein